MTSKKRDNLYVIHIGECLARIESYIAGGKDDFMTSTLVQDAVVRNLQTMGESVRRLSDDAKAAYPNVAWGQIIGFRNVLVHDYLNLDLDVIWEVIEQDLPLLKQAISQMRASIDQGK